MARTNLNPNNTPKNEGVEKQNQNPQDAQPTNPPVNPTDNPSGNPPDNPPQDNDSEKPQGDNSNPNNTPKNEGVDFGKEYVVVNPEKANKKLCGISGDIIEFNDKGEATVGMADAMRFQKCFEGYTVKEK